VKRALTLARKEMRDIVRERTIVMAVLVQLFVAAFSAFLAVGLLTLYDPGAVGAAPDMRVAYHGEGDFDDVLADSGPIEVVDMEPEEAREAFEAGRVSGVIAEHDLGEDQPRLVTATVPEDEIVTSLLVTELKSALDTYEQQLRDDRSQRLDHPITYADNDADPSVAFTFAYSILIPLLVATPVFLAGAITADALSDEINEGTLPLLQASPLTSTEIVLGKLAAPVLLVPLQVAAWVALLWFNGLPVVRLDVVLLAATLMGALLAGCGTLVAAYAQREGPTQAVYTVLVLGLGLLSLLAPQDPANLIALASVGALGPASWVTIGLYAILATVTVLAGVLVVRHRMRADQLRPGAG
jgi:ABC-type transport system involved in multi-copper enzyme maturation permease subunit